MASVRLLRSLTKGQIIQAKVEDVNSVEDILCDIQGELLLAKNITGQRFKKQDPILLQVIGVNPLRFQIYDPQAARFQRVI